MTTYDLAVVGLGAVGGAAVLAAARAGAKVVGFDRASPPHENGSSHGETRIVRAAIGEGEEYTPFALRSFELFDQLADETGTALVTRCGLLILGETLPHATHVGASFLETTIMAAKAHGIPYEMLSASAVRARFPAFATFDGARAYFEPGAGMAHPERVVAAQLARAQTLGAVLHRDTQVLKIATVDDGIAVRTARETIRAAHAIVAAGAWLPSFLPEPHARRLTVTRQVLHWFDLPEPPADYRPARMPAFIWDDIYGFPEAESGNGIKIATERLSDIVEPDSNWRAIDEGECETLSRQVRKAFPALGARLRSATCLYTSTPNFHFWIAPHPDIAHTTVVAACSGHGFKHAPAIGEAVVGEALSLPTLKIPPLWRTIGS